MPNDIAYSRTYATSLLKGVQILNLFSREKSEWRVGEMSKKIGAAKSTVSRIARTLESEGYLQRIQGREGYRLGLRLWELGEIALYDQSEFAERSLSVLEDLRKKTNYSVQAAVLDGVEVVYVQKVDALQAVRTYVPIGARFPSYCTAAGKALLAFQSEEAVEKVIRKGIKAVTAHTVGGAAALRAELDDVRRLGFATTRGEWRVDVAGIAAPVFDRSGNAVGALSLIMPLANFSKEPRSPVVMAVLAAARALSLQFGFAAGAKSGLRAVNGLK
jgi:IclR family transcriptional regulator, KDG regulon repressor